MRESQPVMTILDNPLLVTGRFKNGRTLAFTGFTPKYVETRASWDNKAIFPYLLDQEFVSNPKAQLYFSLFMKMIRYRFTSLSAICSEFYRRRSLLIAG
jgi:uncharacterized membrane protein